MNKLSALIPVVVTFGILFTMLAVLKLIRQRIQQKSRHPSFDNHLLRIPSKSLLRQVDILNEQIILYLVGTVALPLIIYSSLVSCSYFMATKPPGLVIWISSISSAAVIAHLILSLVRLLNRRREHKLNFEGELAVGHELNRLMYDGYRVYHDFPTDNCNIDHVVAGPKGVFAVETSTALNNIASGQNSEPTVDYDGRMLYYPNKSDFETIEQAEQQAEWLSEWLGTTTGEPIAVRAIVAMPGWVVKRTSADGIPVVNPSQFASLFEHIQPRPLSEPMLNRIMEELEQKSASFETPSSRDGSSSSPDPV